MLAPESNLHHLPWEELLSDIQYLLDTEAERLTANKVYYQKLFYTENVDKTKLTKLYNRIQQEQQRYEFFSELLSRIQTYNAHILIKAMEECENTEKAINGKTPENWQIIIKKENENLSFYYYPIKQPC